MSILREENFLDEDQITRVIAAGNEIEFIDLSADLVDLIAAHMVISECANQHNVIPVTTADNKLRIAMSEPIPDDAMSKYKEIRDMSMLSSKNHREATKKDLLETIKKLQNEKNPEAPEELFSNLTSLEKILSEEMQETLDSSEKVLAGN